MSAMHNMIYNIQTVQTKLGWKTISIWPNFVMKSLHTIGDYTWEILFMLKTRQDEIPVWVSSSWSIKQYLKAKTTYVMMT